MMPNPSKIKLDKPFTWEESRDIIDNNKLELLARSQLETNRYINFKHELKVANVNIMDHVLEKELGWSKGKLILDNAEDNKRSFVDPSTIKIIYNQFPYYFPSNVQHLCIWSSIEIPNDPNSAVGDISSATKEVINRYIEKTFTKKYNLDPEQICWFKNWGSLQSIKSISHIHIVIRDFDVASHGIVGGFGEPLTVEEFDEISK